jgi:F420-dependent oxidoreductase-like protein
MLCRPGQPVSILRWRGSRRPRANRVWLPARTTTLDSGSNTRQRTLAGTPALPAPASRYAPAVKLGLQIDRFDWPGGTEAIATTLARMVRHADDVGFDSIWLMDHFFQIRGVGPATDPMLEGMTALGYMAAHTQQARLGLMVGGIHYRSAGLWVKATTTLDVLSGGRAWFGIGAAWNREESEALGFGFPTLGDRFEMLEETLRFAHGMFAGERGSEATLEGRHVRATRMLNSPQAISRPRVPILVGGGGERRTLRLVARYADACNVFGGPVAIHHKFEVLREHCRALERDPDEIERTTLQDVRLTGSRAETASSIVDRFGELRDAGAEHVIMTLPSAHDPAQLELIGRDVIPALRDL